MDTFEHNLQRGTVERIALHILYPDGTVVDNAFSPEDEHIGGIVFSDLLLEKFVLPNLSDEDRKETSVQWAVEGKDWKHRPTYLSFPTSRGISCPHPHCRCLHEHFVKQDKKEAASHIVIQPTTESLQQARSMGIDERGKILEIDIDTRYPSRERVHIHYELLEEPIGMILFSDDVLEKLLIPSLAPAQKSVITEWENKSSGWENRPSYIIVPSPDVLRGVGECGSDPACKCCHFLHKSSELLG